MLDGHWRIRRSLPAGFKQNLANALGWKTGRRIVVFESDDWGSVRMPSQSVYKALAAKGLAIEDCFNRFDSLETRQDLLSLYEILDKHRDSRHRPPVITANFLVANPDFQRILESHYQEYNYELFTETYARHPGAERSFESIREGMAAGLFRPQLHGREHLNVSLWMAALQDGDQHTLLAFDHGFWGHETHYPKAKYRFFLAALDYNESEEAQIASKCAAEAAKLFNEIFGFRSKTFTGPNHIWGPSVESALSEVGVEALQGQRIQLVPGVGNSHYGRRFHYTGQVNQHGQCYLVRNAAFEPATDLTKEWIADCIREIQNAFAWKTPAIVSVHRVNFMGSINPNNRDNNLQLFNQLLKTITTRWPEVEFMSSDQISDIIREGAGK
jgi:hypothetical protein